MCAKVGGVPWIMEQVPFTEAPAMVVGMELYYKGASKKQGILSFCATINRSFTKYWSVVKEIGSGEDLASIIATCFMNSMKEFVTLNKFAPVNIIVYRDGVS